jgi:hypothetical protein
MEIWPIEPIFKDLIFNNVGALLPFNYESQNGNLEVNLDKKDNVFLFIFFVSDNIFKHIRCNKKNYV